MSNLDINLWGQLNLVWRNTQTIVNSILAIW